MRFFQSRSLLAGATALLFVVACGGNNAGQSPSGGTTGPVNPPATTSTGGSTDEPVVTLAPDSTTGTAGEATSAPDATSSPGAVASPDSGASWTDIGAVAVAIGPSAILPLEGTCTIAPPPEDPEAPALPDPGPGDLPFIAGSTFTVSLADAGTTTPDASPAPEATADATSNSVEVTVVLSTLSDPDVPAIPVVEESPDPDATEPPSTDAILPFSIDPTTATVTASFPNQFIFEPTIAGGAVARDAHSGYFALDPGTGELVLVHFLCNELVVATEAPEAPASPASSPEASPAASPEASPAASPEASPAVESPAASPAESPGASPTM